MSFFLIKHNLIFFLLHGLFEDCTIYFVDWLHELTGISQGSWEKEHLFPSRQNPRTKYLEQSTWYISLYLNHGVLKAISSIKSYRDVKNQSWTEQMNNKQHFLPTRCSSFSGEKNITSELVKWDRPKLFKGLIAVTLNTEYKYNVMDSNKINQN